MYRRKPNRLKCYDYSLDDLYFITSCVKDMVCFFGNIVGTGRDLSREPKMILNEFGKIAEQQWFWLGEQYAFTNLHEFIVMPNHMHGIIEINSVGIGRDLSLEKSEHGHLVNQKIKSISEIISAYKMTVSKDIHLLGYPEFAWQRSFHTYIIRDQKDYERISHYIINNVNTWDNDKYRM